MRFEVAGSEFQSGIQEGCASKKLYTIETSFRFGCCGWRLRETNGGVLFVGRESPRERGPKLPDRFARLEAVDRTVPFGAFPG